MAYTTAQQARLDAAQAKVNQTKPIYDSNAERYNSWTSTIHCYGGTFPSLEEARTGTYADVNTCTSSGKSCKQSDQRECKNLVGQLNSDVIPGLIAAYSNYHNAITEQLAVIAAVGSEASADPATIAGTAAAAATAAAQPSATATITKQKYIFWAIVIVVVGFLVFAYFKWFKK